MQAAAGRPRGYAPPSGFSPSTSSLWCIAKLRIVSAYVRIATRAPYVDILITGADVDDGGSIHRLHPRTRKTVLRFSARMGNRLLAAASSVLNSFVSFCRSTVGEPTCAVCALMTR